MMKKCQGVKILGLGIQKSASLAKRCHDIRERWLRVPLSTLRRGPYGHRRMTRGPDDWLSPSGVTLAFTTPGRF
jgi:hypothetical protein